MANARWQVVGLLALAMVCIATVPLACRKEEPSANSSSSTGTNSKPTAAGGRVATVAIKDDTELLTWFGTPKQLSLGIDPGVHNISGVKAAEALFSNRQEGVLQSKKFAEDLLTLCRDLAKVETQMAVGVTFQKAADPRELMARIGPPKGAPGSAEEDGRRWQHWTDVAQVGIGEGGIVTLRISCTEYATRGSIIDYGRAAANADAATDFNRVLLNKDEVASCAAHNEAIWALAVSPDGTLLASGTSDPGVKIWSLSDGKLLKTLQSKPALSWDDGVYNLSFTKDGKFFVSGCGGQMSVFSLPSWNLIGTRPGPHGRQYRMGLLGKGDEAACVVNTGGSVERNVVCLVPLAGGEPTELGKGAPTPCLTGQLTVSHDGKHLLLYDTAKIQVWSLAKRQLLKEAKLPKSITSCPLFSPKDDEFIYLSDEGTVERVAFPSLDVKGSLKGDDGVCGPIALSSDGSLLATGGRDNTVRLQSMPDGKLLRVLKGHPKDMESIVFSPDGKKLISGDSGGTIIIWELEPNGRHWALRDFGW